MTGPGWNQPAPPAELTAAAAAPTERLAGTVAAGAPPVLPSWAYPPESAPAEAGRDRRTTAILGSVLAALVVAAVVIAVVWIRGDSSAPTAAVSAPTPTAGPATSASSTGPSAPTTAAVAPPVTVTVVTTTAVPGVPQAPGTVTVTATPSSAPVAPPTTPAPVQPAPAPGGRRFGDLGLSTPISTVSCTGTAIVLYSSAITPGAYAADIQASLDDHPGASYLRTDQACSSLTPSIDGNAVYAVFRAYPSTTAACAAEGDGASFRLLDNGDPDSSTFGC